MLSRRRQPGRQGVTARWAVVIALLGTLVACTTAPDLSKADLAIADLAPEIPNSPWQTETLITADPAVPVTVTILDPPPTPEQVQIAGAVRGDGGLYFGATPWRRSIAGRRPVGVVVASGQVRSNPVPPYWSVVLARDGRWQMVAQRELSDIELASDGAVPGTIHLAVGGFYPLIAHGQVVAGEFPGRTIRAPRVAIGGTAGDDPRLVIVATGSGRGAEAAGGGAGVGAASGGLTTVELAHLLQRYDLDWALNLDGGRSAFVQFPNGQVRPQRLWFRRRGPVLVRIEPSESSPDLESSTDQRKVVE